MDAPVNLSREAALRIALAARTLPGTSVGQLLGILRQQLEVPLTEETLQRVTVSDLKIGLAGSEEDVDMLDTPMSALKEAVRLLWGEPLDQPPPAPSPLGQVPPHSIRVAVASNSGDWLDGHFGSCRRFLVYQVDAEAITLLDVRSTEGADLAEDRNGYRVGLIRDCQVLYAQTIGAPAGSKVVRAGIYLLTRIQGGSAADVLAELQRVMGDAPPPWLAKLLGKGAQRRLRFSVPDEEEAED